MKISECRLLRNHLSDHKEEEVLAGGGTSSLAMSMRKWKCQLAKELLA
jgi:hypothetical protein